MQVVWPITLNIPRMTSSINRNICRIKKYICLQCTEFFMLDLAFKFLSSILLCMLSFNTRKTFEWNMYIQVMCHSFLLLISLIVVSLILSYSQTNALYALYFTHAVILNQRDYSIQLSIAAYCIMFWTRD